jgi:hypothetical protein
MGTGEVESLTFMVRTFRLPKDGLYYTDVYCLQGYRGFDCRINHHFANLKDLAEAHLKACQEILDGKYWYGGWALP